MRKDDESPIEGEIIEKKLKKEKAQKVSAPKQSVHWGVYSSVLLAGVVAGLFAAPYAERGLQMLGWIDAAESRAPLADITEVHQARIDAHEIDMAALIERMAEIEHKLENYNEHPNAMPKTQGVPQPAAPAFDSAPLLARMGNLEAQIVAMAAQIEATGVANEKAIMGKAAKMNRLHEALKPLIVPAMRAEMRDGSTGWWDSFLRWGKSLVVVRPTDDLEGDSLAARLSRMEKALNNADIEAAKISVLELELVAEPAAKILAPWLEKARQDLNMPEKGADESTVMP